MSWHNKFIHKTIVIDASVSQVWNALTKPELMKQWLWENEVEVISDWEEGSAMVFKSTFHDKPYTDIGHILTLEKETCFRYHYWSHLSQLPDSTENYQEIEFRLVPVGHSTELILTCRNTINEAIYGHWNFYWTMTLGILKQIIEASPFC